MVDPPHPIHHTYSMHTASHKSIAIDYLDGNFLFWVFGAQAAHNYPSPFAPPLQPKGRQGGYHVRIPRLDPVGPQHGRGKRVRVREARLLSNRSNEKKVGNFFLVATQNAFFGPGSRLTHPTTSFPWAMCYVYYVCWLGPGPLLPAPVCAMWACMYGVFLHVIGMQRYCVYECMCEHLLHAAPSFPLF